VAGLQRSFTDPRTGQTYAQAYVVIQDIRMHLMAHQLWLDLATYGDAAAASSGTKAPVANNPDFALTPAEINTLQNAFFGQLYQILQARPEFAGSVIVP